MSERQLRKKLIRLAHEDPRLRPHLLPILEAHRVAMQREAFGKETQDFAEWALNQLPMAASEVEKIVRGTLKIKTSPKVKKRSGPRFQAGDRVTINKDKQKDAATAEMYERYNGVSGTVVQDDGLDAIVDLDNGQRGIRFPNAQKSRGVGIGKEQRSYTVTGSPMIEMLYKAGGKPTPDQKLVVENYLAGGRSGEQRIGQYYSGSVTFASVGKNGYYFKALPQQRTEIVPGQSYGSYGWRTFSPNVGQVFYIGVLGRRPRAWKGELAEMRAGATV